MWSVRNSHTFLVGMQNYIVTLENSLAVLTKLTILVPYDPATPWYLFKGVENLRIHRNLHVDLNSSFIHNSQNMEATKMSFSR